VFQNTMYFQHMLAGDLTILVFVVRRIGWRPRLLLGKNMEGKQTSG